MSADLSYTAVMAQRAEIMKASVGLDYAQYSTGAIAFDYERLLADTGYDVETAANVQIRTAVGDTPLVELVNVTALVRAISQPGKGARIFVKDEAKNPSGSFKDRRASLSVHEAKKRGYEGVVAATSGNYGAAIASQAAKAGLRCIVVQEAFDSRAIAQPEIAVLFAEEGVNGAHQDPQYNVLYRDINMHRSFVDAAEAKKILAAAAILKSPRRCCVAALLPSASRSWKTSGGSNPPTLSLHVCCCVCLPPSEINEVIEWADVSLNSELSVLAALSEAAQRRGRTHAVIIMVDLGDLREGLWPRELIPFVQEALRLPGIRINGIGTNLACFGGVMPSEANMRRLVEMAAEVERTFGIGLEYISGANSSGLSLIAAGGMPSRVNQARIGEAILLGRETTHRRPWPGTFQDAFTQHAEILELKRKPSAPIGERSEDAFGHLTAFENHGDIERALVNIGREEVDIEGITSRDPRLKILGASSSYLVVDMSEAAGAFKVGDQLSFSLNYGALLSAMTSEYVEKRPAIRGIISENASKED